VDASEVMLWRNRSDQPVDRVYLHMYLNAFEGPGSTYFTERRMFTYSGSGGSRGAAKLKKGQWGYVDLKKVQQDGQDVTWRFVHPDGGPDTDHSVVELDLPMPVRRIEAHPYVAENAGRVALMRGPLLYCLEQVDLGLTAGQTADLRDVVLPASAPFSVRHEPDLLGGVSVLEAEAMVLPPEGGWAWRLYRAACPHSAPSYGEAVQIRAVPYYAWANREAGAMQVWLRTE